jgi:hypothetical protein
MVIPRHKHTIALMISNVFNFIAIPLSSNDFQIVISTPFISKLTIRFIYSKSKLRQQKAKVNFILLQLVIWKMNLKDSKPEAGKAIIRGKKQG